MSTSKREQLGQIVIRPPEGMRDRIKAAAEANNRSMNAEIVATLEEKYPAPMPLTYRALIARTLEILSENSTPEQRAEVALLLKDIDSLRVEEAERVAKDLADPLFNAIEKRLEAEAAKVFQKPDD